MDTTIEMWKSDKLRIQNIYSVSNKDIVAQIVLGRSYNGIGFDNMLVNWGYATVDENFDFIPIGPETPERRKEIWLEIQERAKEYKRGIWADK